MALLVHALLVLGQAGDPPQVLGRQRQPERIECLAWSSDGRSVLTGAGGGPLRFWDASTGRETRRWGKDGITHSIAFSPDGRRLAVAVGGDLIVRNVEDGREARRWEAVNGMFHEATFSPDGKTLLAGGTDLKVHFWDVETGKEFFTWEEKSETVYSVAFSPDGKRVALGGAHGTVRTWDTPPRGEGRKLRPRGQAGVSRVRFSPDGARLAAGGNGIGVVLYDLAAGAERQLVPAGEQVRSLDFSPDGSALAYGGTSLGVVDAGTGKVRFRREAGSGAALVGWSPDGKTLAAGDDGGTLRLIDPESGKDRLDPQGHARAVTSLRLTPDGRRLVSTDELDARIWDLSTGAQTACIVFGGDTGERFAHLSPDGKMLCFPGRERSLESHDVATGRATRTLALSCNYAAFSPDGRRVAAVGADRRLRLVEIESGAERWTLEPGGWVTLAFSPDGRTLAGGTADHEIVFFWDAETGAQRREPVRTEEFRWVQSLSWSPDGKLAAWNLAGARIRLCDPARGEILETVMIGGEEKVESPSYSFSPDGRLLVSGNTEGELRIFETATGKEVHSLKVDERKAWAVAFAPDGRSVFWGGGEGQILREGIRPEPPPVGETLETLWRTMDSHDAKRAWVGVWALSNRPEARPFIVRKLGEGADEAAVGKILDALEDDDPAVRRKAASDLGRVPVVGAERAIRKKLAEAKSADVREALAPVVADLDSPVVKTPSLLRQIRAVWALELAGARSELETLSGAGPSTRAAREAAAALDRMSRSR